ncbi:MAG: hypothetical protein HYY18_05980 [Planctomycetes bacterium]|nr:hypothetical protein [Planctomycetota bacterium]
MKRLLALILAASCAAAEDPVPVPASLLDAKALEAAGIDPETVRRVYAGDVEALAAARRQAAEAVVAGKLREEAGRGAFAAAANLFHDGQTDRTNMARRIIVRTNLVLDRANFAKLRTTTALAAETPEIVATIAEEAWNLAGGTSGSDTYAVLTRQTGTRFFQGSLVPKSMGDATWTSRAGRGGIDRIKVPPPVPLPKGVKIEFDDAALARAMAVEDPEGEAAWREGLAAVFASEDAVAAWRHRSALFEARKTAWVERTRKVEERRDAAFVPLAALARDLQGYRGRWGERPEALKKLGLSRIHGFARDSEGALVLAGRSEAGAPPISVDDLVVALAAVWRDGATPMCSLDPDPSDIGGPQYSRIGGVPADSAFGLAMLEADYAMKKIMAGVKGEDPGVPGYRTFADCLRQDRGGTPLNRFWLFPVQPGAHEILLAPDGSAALFDARVQVLSEAMAVAERGLAGSGAVSPAADAAARSFSEHFAAIEAARPEFRRLHGLFDLVLLARVLRLAAPADDTLASLAALPHARVDIPRAYAGIKVRHEVPGGFLVLAGGCDANVRAGRRNLVGVTCGALEALAERRLLAPSGGAGAGAGEEIAFAQGLRRSAEGDFGGARASFSEAIAGDPGFAEAWRQRALDSFEAGDRAAAFLDAAEAVRLEPRDPAMRATRRFLMRESELPGALKDIAPDETRALASLYLESAVAAMTAGKFEDAVARTSRAVELAPEAPLAITIRAALRLMTRDLDGAEADATAALAADPGDLFARFVRASIRLFREDFTGAVADADALLAVRQDPFYFAFRGFARFCAGDLERAADDGDRAFAIDPACGMARVLEAGLRYALQAGPEKAREISLPQLRLPPAILLPVGEGLDAIQAGDAPAAVDALRHALRLFEERAAEPAVRQGGIVREAMSVLLAQQLGAAARARPARREEYLQALRELSDGMSKRHPDWITPDFLRTIGYAGFGMMPEAIDALENAETKENDPVVSLIVDTGGAKAAAFAMLLRIALTLQVSPVSPEAARAAELRDRFAALLKDAPSGPAAAAIRDMAPVLARDERKAVDFAAAGARACSGRLSGRNSPLDSLVAGLFYGMAIPVLSRYGTFDDAERAARDYFAIVFADDTSPLIAIIGGNWRFQAITYYSKALMQKFPDDPRLKEIDRTSSSPEESVRRLKEVVEDYVRRARDSGEPAVALLVANQLSDSVLQGESELVRQDFAKKRRDASDGSSRARIAEEEKEALANLASRARKELSERIDRAERDSRFPAQREAVRKVLAQMTGVDPGISKPSIPDESLVALVRKVRARFGGGPAEPAAARASSGASDRAASNGWSTWGWIAGGAGGGGLVILAAVLFLRRRR